MCKKQLAKKNKNITFTPFLLTFKEREPPGFLEIPEEQAKTKVYEFYERPMSCKKFLKYGHTVKGCHETIVTCARCRNQVHNKDKCTSNEVKAPTAKQKTKHSQGTDQYSKE